MTRRSYSQYCGVAKALDVVGERWTLLIVRNLLLGAQRYTELLRRLPGITTNLLAKRLREMEREGLIERVQPAGVESSAYRLTERGAALEPVVHALGRWGWGSMEAPGEKEHRSFDFLMVALRRRYRGATTLRAEVVADGVPYRLILADDLADISRGDVTAPDVRVRGSGAAVARLFLGGAEGGQPPAGVEIDGSADGFRALVSAFAPSDGQP